MFHITFRRAQRSTLARETAFLLWALVLAFATSCVDADTAPSPTPTPTVVATAVIDDPLVDEWAMSVCLAINDVSPNLRAAINDDDPEDALADRKQRLNDLRATYRDELGILTRTLDAIDAPSPMRSFHAQLVDMYRSAATELNAAAPQWRAAQTGEEFDAVRISIYRQIEIVYLRLARSTEEGEFDGFVILPRAGCAVETPLGRWALRTPS